jgi:tetratricopeptide (TPR) repeat protein
VLQRDKRHAGANHYYIHAMEATQPEKAESAADRLLHLAPGAGHLVHMPAHIFVRVGRYADAAAANEKAILADEDYITQCRAQGIYPLGYYPHNIHFLWLARTMEGNSGEAIRAARKAAAQIKPEDVKNLPILQTFLVTPYFALVRFGKWDEILSEPQPSAGLFSEGMWRYARAMALIRKQRFAEAEKELETLTRLSTDKNLIETPATFSSNTPEGVFRIVPPLVAGELAAARGDYDKAIALLEKAVRLEDALNYAEPPDWHAPVRHALGAVLLDAKRPVEAEVVFWDDLKKNPENGWALFGLATAMKAQGKTEEAAAIEKRFEKAWSRADVRLTTSRY